MNVLYLKYIILFYLCIMNRLFTYFGILLLLSFLGCSRNSKDLQRAQQLLETAPDSALHILQQIVAPNSMADADKALYGILLFEALDKNYLPLTPDTLINQSIEYFEEYAQKTRLATAYLYKARMYMAASQYEDASICLMHALDNADKTIDFALLGRIHTDLGTISFLQRDYVDARNEYKQKFFYFRKAKMATHTLDALLAIGRTYFAEKNCDSASVYYKQALGLATDSMSKGNCMQEIAQNYYEQKNYDSALHYLRPIIHYPYFDTNRAMRYYVLADVFFDCNQYDSAYIYAKRAFQFKPCIIIRKGCYRILVNTTYLQNKSKEMAHYTSLHSDCQDTLRRIQSQTKVSVLKKMNQADKQIQADQLHIAILALLLSLLLVLALIIIYFIYQKHNTDKQAHEAKLLLAHEAELQHAHSKLLAHEAELQQAHSKLLAKQTQIIEECKQKIETERNKRLATRKKWTQAERKVMILELYESTLCLSDWCVFSRLMNYTFNNVVCVLESKSDEIKKEEIIWCCLYLLKVPTDDRLIVLNISTDSMYKLKQRLAIKLKLDGAKMVDEYLKQFYTV